MTIAPEDFGIARCTKEDLLGGDPAANAQITKEILRGRKGHKTNAVLLNAGAGLYITGKADTIQEGIRMAEELIDSGAAMRVLETMIRVSNE